jgi:S-adenosylmethionine:tRNA ribosyltransferase-isomerase
VRPGTRLVAGPDLTVVVGGTGPGDGTRLVDLEVAAGGDELDALDRHGAVPLPPYITAPLADPERYQTVFADRPGSVAAPTAGLHLTPAVLDACRAAGARVADVELVVGMGTFRPMAVDKVEDHHMHAERFRVPEATLAACTELFVRRPWAWRLVDVLMTNFHLPRSSLLVLVDAFVGPRWRDLYAEARRAGYRFLSFGDAMWLVRTEPGAGEPAAEGRP